jgi:DNA topoisomerase-1
VKLKVPDVLSDEFCDVCGKQMVVKKGRFGHFLACPGFPECTFTKPIVVEMPGKCPRCGSRILKRTSKKGYTYYACERGAECGFMTWDVPTKDYCPDCGKTLFKRSGKGRNKPYCINEECVSFVPEDKRGYKKKTVTEENGEAPVEATEETEKKTTKKTAAKKTAEKKTTEKKTTKKTTKSASKKKAEAE